MGTLDSANLTSGKGGIGADFTAEDHVRAIRHGINREGKPIFMPAVVSTARQSDEDLGAVMAYVRTLPAVDRLTYGNKFTPLAKTLLAAGMLGDLPVKAVSHEVHVTAPERAVTVEYGEHLVKMHDGRLCHGARLNGGRHADPAVRQISSDLTPGGHELNTDLMRWKEYRNFSDDELKAIFLYLQSLPKLPQNTR